MVIHPNTPPSVIRGHFQTLTVLRFPIILITSTLPDAAQLLTTRRLSKGIPQLSITRDTNPPSLRPRLSYPHHIALVPRARHITFPLAYNNNPGRSRRWLSILSHTLLPSRSPTTRIPDSRDPSDPETKLALPWRTRSAYLHTRLLALPQEYLTLTNTKQAYISLPPTYYTPAR